MKIGLNEHGLPLILNNRDTAHNAAFCAIAMYYNKLNHRDMMEPIEKILFKNLFYQIKNPTYVFSNTEDWRKTLYDKFLSKIEIKKGLLDFYAGSNPDQINPCLAYYNLVGDKNSYYQTIKILLGLSFRLGFWPNGEHILFKPHTIAPALRLFKLKPLYWIADIFAYISGKHELKRTIAESTTNKIRMYLYLIQAEIQPTFWSKKLKNEVKNTKDYKILKNLYWNRIFQIYFKLSSPVGTIVHLLNMNLV